MAVLHAAPGAVSRYLCHLRIGGHDHPQGRLQKRDVGFLRAILPVFGVRGAQYLMDRVDGGGVHHAVHIRVRCLQQTDRPFRVALPVLHLLLPAVIQLDPVHSQRIRQGRSLVLDSE